MKRIVLILALLSFWDLRNTFADDTGDAFEAATIQRSDSITKALQRKEYAEAVDLINDWLATYEDLPASKRAQYKQQKLNGYYLSVCAHLASGDLDGALDEFEALVYNGYTNFRQASTDKRLKRLRGNERFEELLMTVEERGDFLGVLKSSGPYKQQKSQPSVRFSFPKDDTNLLVLRKKYSLDSVAGAGEEHSQIIRLMQWVHHSTYYDGKQEDAQHSDTRALLAAEKRKLNCRDLAIILKDVYAATGFSARYVYCQPKDTFDSDCHVVTIVFSRSQNKWVMMDPSNEAYLMDEKGRLLGLDEVRARLIAGKPITLNGEANQNGTPIKLNDYLFGYLAKNLFWFESPLSSAYNYESGASGKKVDFLRLYPSGFGGSGLILHRFGLSYITRDATLFWKAPDLDP